MLTAYSLCAGLFLGFALQVVAYFILRKIKISDSLRTAVACTLSFAAAIALWRIQVLGADIWIVGGVGEYPILFYGWFYTWGKPFFLKIWQKQAEPLKQWAIELGEYSTRTAGLRAPEETTLLKALDAVVESATPMNEQF